MVRVIMHGCNGRMGQMIAGLLKEDTEAEIVAGVDMMGGVEQPFPVFSDLADCTVEADVVIDFSNAKVTSHLLEVCVKKGLPVVLCTTGLSEEQLVQVEEAGRQVAVLKSANMSLGINLLMKVLGEITPVLAQAGFDIEIVEKHHNQKLDAPSGTALALADAINDAADQSYAYVYDRSRERKLRDKKELGISAVRGGTIVGEHEVIFAGTDEVITLRHTAYSRAVFGKGAIQAAKYLAGKPAGLYNMNHVING